MKVLLSVKPEYAEKIFAGEKRFEFRKARFKREVDTVIVYATMPIGKIIGEFTIKDILSDTPSSLWKKTKEYAGISLSFFMKYFSGKEIGYAIEIYKPTRYDVAKNPFDDDPKFMAPQSFRYIS